MIIHLDADCFFVAVERVKDPTLIGKPVIVGGSVRGVVASASYEARKFGVHAAMPVWQARRLCSSAIFVPVDMDSYAFLSDKLFELLDEFSPYVERCSIDEGYLDVSYSKDPVQLSKNLQSSVLSQLGITVSLGLANSKLVSQIAGKMHKPSGFTHVPVGQEKEFLATLDISWLPGFGEKTSERIRAFGIRTIGDIASLDIQKATVYFGKRAPQILELANGVDRTSVDAEEHAAKSFGEQETFELNTRDKEFVLRKLLSMLDNLMRKVRKTKKFVCTVEVRLRSADFVDFVKSAALKDQTDNEELIYPLIKELLDKVWVEQAFRLVGVKVSNLTECPPNGELNLFDTPATKSVTTLLDSLKDVIGEGKISRAHAVVPKNHK